MQYLGLEKITNKTKIFTDSEMKAMEERQQGSKKDDTGIYAARVKPKIIDMLERWFPKKKQLKKLINLGTTKVKDDKI